MGKSRSIIRKRFVRESRSRLPRHTRMRISIKPRGSNVWAPGSSLERNEMIWDSRGIYIGCVRSSRPYWCIVGYDAATVPLSTEP